MPTAIAIHEPARRRGEAPTAVDAGSPHAHPPWGHL